jgi:hypothetical protein
MPASLIVKVEKKLAEQTFGACFEPHLHISAEAPFLRKLSYRSKK